MRIQRSCPGTRIVRAALFALVLVSWPGWVQAPAPPTVESNNGADDFNKHEVLSSTKKAARTDNHRQLDIFEDASSLSDPQEGGGGGGGIDVQDPVTYYYYPPTRRPPKRGRRPPSPHVPGPPLPLPPRPGPPRYFDPRPPAPSPSPNSLVHTFLFDLAITIPLTRRLLRHLQSKKKQQTIDAVQQQVADFYADVLPPQIPDLISFSIKTINYDDDLHDDFGIAVRYEMKAEV